jgi:murein DD-endopeptidase MepM/ murein hydrolase activator NlpD
MTTRSRSAVLLAGFLLTLFGLAIPRPAAAADDFTLPFHNPGVTLSYGVDRDSRAGYQLDWTGQLWKDTVPHWGRVYDQHTGLDYPMSLYSPIAAARSGTVVDIQEAFGTTQYGDFGNFVRLRHADGRDTLYYHLAQGGALVGMGQTVVAGQTIAQSGCSGLCYGAHLHFELLRLVGSGWQSVDPMADRLWTTWPGRVPFAASYVRESNAGTVTIKRQATVTHWVEFRNTGGRTWARDATSGRLLLGTWSPAGRSSAFRASDWPATWVPTYLDPASVAPDGIGRFTFGLRAAVSPGSYSEPLNLRADPLFWFDHTRLGGYHVPIYVTSGQIQ